MDALLKFPDECHPQPFFSQSPFLFFRPDGPTYQPSVQHSNPKSRHPLVVRRDDTRAQVAKEFHVA